VLKFNFRVLLISFTILTFFNSNAASSTVEMTFNAYIEFILPLSISAGTPLNFGSVVLPPSGSENLTINHLTENSSSGTISILGGQNRGSHDISGSNHQNYQLAITAYSSLIGISFTNITALVLGAGNNDSCSNHELCNISSLNINGGYGGTLYVGASINIASTVNTGTYNNGELQYTIALEYE